MKSKPGLFERLLRWLRGTKTPEPAEGLRDLHPDQRLAEPHYAGIQAMEDTLFMELDEALGLADAANVLVDKDGKSPPLEEQARETCFIAAYAIDTAARLEKDRGALESGLHRALRGQCGTALSKRYAKTVTASGLPVDKDQMLKAAIQGIYRAELIAQALAEAPDNLGSLYDLIGGRIGVRPVDFDRRLKGPLREAQVFARKIPSMFEQLKANDPSL